MPSIVICLKGFGETVFCITLEDMLHGVAEVLGAW